MTSRERNRFAQKEDRRARKLREAIVSDFKGGMSREQVSVKYGLHVEGVDEVLRWALWGVKK